MTKKHSQQHEIGKVVRGILYTDYRTTCTKLVSLGLQNDEGVIHETS